MTDSNVCFSIWECFRCITSVFRIIVNSKWSGSYVALFYSSIQSTLYDITHGPI